MLKIHKSTKEPTTIIREASQLELVNYENALSNVIKQQLISDPIEKEPRTKLKGLIFKNQYATNSSAAGSISLTNILTYR